MIFIGIVASIAAIGTLCWLLFTLAVLALPLFAGVAAGMWAHDSGAGWLGGFVVGAIAAGLTYGVGQFLLAFVAPAALAGYHATHGIVKHTMPSETWQILFSVIGAVAVGVTALLKMTTMATPGPGGGSVAHG